MLGDPKALGAARDLLGFYETYWRRYGDTFRVQMMGGARAPGMIVVAHPEGIKHVLWTNRQNYVKGSVYAGARRVMGDSLLTLEGDAWKERRNLEQPAFHRKSIERLAAQMVSSGASFFDALVRRADGGTVTIDAHREMVQLTLDVVVRALFGQILESNPVSYETLSAALELVSDGANRLVLPAWVPTPGNRKLHRTLATLDRTMYSFVDTARRSDRGDSLLSMLVNTRDASGAPLEDRVIRDEVMTMFIAGHETTALTLTWLFTLLYNRSDVISRMQAEVDETLGSRAPSFDDLPNLRYLRQVVDETLRLRPPAPLVARNTLADDSIDGYRVKAGDMIMPFVWACHRHPDFWAEPLRFNPDRFEQSQTERRHSWSYLPFSAGPRSCIGNTFSLVETVILLAQLVQRFDIDVAPCADVKPIALATARPSRPIRVVLRTRGAWRAS
jgi:cytochrome P450